MIMSSLLQSQDSGTRDPSAQIVKPTLDYYVSAKKKTSVNLRDVARNWDPNKFEFGAFDVHGDAEEAKSEVIRKVQR